MQPSKIQHPWLCEVVMFFGSISGVVISIPCGLFLTM